MSMFSVLASQGILVEICTGFVAVSQQFSNAYGGSKRGYLANVSNAAVFGSLTPSNGALDIAQSGAILSGIYVNAQILNIEITNNLSTPPNGWNTVQISGAILNRVTNENSTPVTTTSGRWLYKLNFPVPYDGNNFMVVGTSNNISFCGTASSTNSQPSAPTGVTAFANSSTQIVISWNTVSNADYYILERTTTTSPPTFATIYSGSINNFNDNNLTQSTTYYYRVLAVNNNGSSSYSNIASDTTFTDGGFSQ
jgi:hypothetical protein